MTWTTQKPTKPGFWFYRNGFTRTMFLIMNERGELQTEYYTQVKEIDGGEWAGPIPEPEEVV